MNKVKELLSNSKVKVATVATTALLVVPQYAFAVGETDAISTALTAVKTDLMAAIGVVAPLAIGVFGATFVWKKGISFFSSIARK